ncbi:MAG: elongation factor G [Eubacterium sp.]|nr:elongation factor G [Eubacterium sp.]MCR5291634.1 elongation factor G [Eubacterium sp.]
MNVFTTDKIRNVVLLGHGGSGKTSLVEAIAYLAGMTNRMGTVDSGNTLSDYDKEEIKRKISIKTTVVPVQWEGYKVNLIDTPGYFDFVGEVEEAASVADAAIIVISAKTGIEVGTKRAWELCEKRKLPRMFFVTDMDEDQASYREVVEGLQALYGKRIAPFHLPIRENEQFVGYVNVIQQKAKRWNDKGTVDKFDVPDYSLENLNICRDALLEAVAETSEEFMERFFEGDEFSEDEIRSALRVGVHDGSVVPVLMGSNTLARGQFTLMADIIKYFPSPDRCKIAGINTENNEVFEADYDFSKPKSAYVFKTIADPYIGKYSLIKVNSGVLKSDDVLFNYHRDAEERLGKIYTICGNKVEEVKELHAGDIGALAKLTVTQTTDTLSTKKNPVTYIRAAISKPYVYRQYKAKNKGDEDKISQALSKLLMEDLTLRYVNDSENSQTLLYGISATHLEVVQNVLREKYKVDIDLLRPKVAFKETITKKADTEYKYKKQSGGHGQYGHVKITMEPSGDMETPYIFEQTVVGGAVPKNYFPAVEKGIAESVKRGPLATYPVTGVKVVLYDGSYHAVDSSEMAFKTASEQAFKKAFMEAGPVLLEPIANIKVIVPDEYTGAVLGDFNKRRARVLGMNPTGEGGYTVIEADIPYIELYEYDTKLYSMTKASGIFSYEFVRYEQAPQEVADREIAAAQAEQ